MNYYCCFFKKNKSITPTQIQQQTVNNNITWDSTQIYIPPVEKGCVIKVYDGDTITIATTLPPYHSTMYRFSVRLKDIDCPEMKSHNKEEKELAQIAQKKLSDLVLHKTVHLKNVKLEKYGRLLADVYLEDLHLNNYMITNKLAVEYDGKTKHSFT